ncbi:MAG: segregation/condensation protein A [Firmicutes bacterium]|nr:segregation/condensation protein A [Bacillota bacterium]
MSIHRAGTEYRVKLEDFEGPLDLLLHVIRDAKLDIKTVPLASVTKQYLAFLDELGTLDLNLASEFIEVGATLIEIKSRQILPKPKVEEEETAEEIEERLRARLEEYKLLKEASDKLKQVENVNRFYKDPEPIREIIKYKFDNLDLSMLVEAFSRVMHRVEKSAAPPPQRAMRLDRFTVADKMKSIRDELKHWKKFNFFKLFGDDYSRGEVINTFLAVLELLKNGEIRAVQEQKFADIEITRVEGAIAPEEDKLEYTIIDGIED